MRTRASLILSLAILPVVPVFGQLKVVPNGHVGIGTNDPAVRLHVEGEGLVNSHAAPWESAFTTRVHYKNSSAFHLWNGYYGKDVFFANGEGWTWSMMGHYTGSDSSVIRDPAPIENALNSVLLLNGLRFRYMDGRTDYLTDSYRLGLVAQEVQQLVPDAVRIMPDSSLAVSYDDLIPLIVEAMQEQQAQIELLRTTLSDQSEEIKRLKRRRWFRKSKNNGAE